MRVCIRRAQWERGAALMRENCRRAFGRASGTIRGVVNNRPRMLSSGPLSGSRGEAARRMQVTSDSGSLGIARPRDAASAGVCRCLRANCIIPAQVRISSLARIYIYFTCPAQRRRTSYSCVQCECIYTYYSVHFVRVYPVYTSWRFFPRPCVFVCEMQHGPHTALYHIGDRVSEDTHICLRLSGFLL